MEMQTGSKQSRKDIVVKQKDVVTVTAAMASNHAVSITKTPTGTGGALGRR